MALFKKNNQVRQSKGSARRSPVNTYYRAAGKTDSPDSPFTKRTPKNSVRKFLFGFLDIILIGLVLAGLGYSLIIKPSPAVKVTSEAFHPAAVYQSEAAAQLGQLKNRNKITFSESSLASGLEAKFPEITNVNVELPLLSEKPKLLISIGQPSFQLNTRGQNYIINSRGTAIANSSDLPKLKDLLTIHDDSNFVVKPGAKVLSAQAVSFVNNLIAQSRHAQIPISSLTLPNRAQEIDLRTSDQPYFVKFYLGGDPLVQTGQFIAARSRFTQNSQTPGQYLDVRVNGKIFYK